MQKSIRLLCLAALAAFTTLTLAPAVSADVYDEMKLEAAALRVELMADATESLPGNDECANPFGDLAVGTVTSGSSTGATLDAPPAPDFCGTSINGPGVWYTVTGTGNTMSASTCLGGGNAGFDSKISVFCDDCEDLKCVAGNDDDSACGFAFTSTASWTSQPGAKYRILVHGFAGSQGDFDLAILDDGVPATADVECPPGDSDGDGVADPVDFCPDTVIPESVPTSRLGVNRFALVDDNGIFDTTSPQGRGPRLTFSIEDTAGCSCEQIIAELGLGKGHEKFGCSISAMEDWVEVVAPLTSP